METKNKKFSKYHKPSIDYNSVIKDFKNGTNILELSLKYDRCKTTIKRILKENKLLKNKKKYTSLNINKEELQKLIEKNQTLNYISKYFRCSKTTISKYMKIYNLIFDKKHTYFKPHKNQKFSKLYFIKEIKTKGKRIKWLCKCECGTKKEILAKSIINNLTKSCGCLQKEIIRGNRYTGFEDISGHYWSSIKQAAKIRNIEFKINIGYAWELFIKQNKKCALSDLDICFNKSKIDNVKFYNASLDRIDSKIGYIKENVQWVAREVNMMKWKLNNNDFINFCNKISKKNSK